MSILLICSYFFFFFSFLDLSSYLQWSFYSISFYKTYKSPNNNNNKRKNTGICVFTCGGGGGDGEGGRGLGFSFDKAIPMKASQYRDCQMPKLHAAILEILVLKLINLVN